MTRPLLSNDALILYARMRPLAKDVLVAFNEGLWRQGRDGIAELHTILSEARTAANNAEEQYVNDIFVLDRYADFLSAYGDLWEQIVNERFSDSWCSLQEALDLLRLIKRFSHLDVDFFETQLTELEPAYSYAVFVSVGTRATRASSSPFRQAH